jgi:hypothetical protein
MNDLLATLNDISNRITELLIHTAPEGNSQPMRDLAALQDRVVGACNHLIETRFKAALVNLAGPTAAIEQLSKDLNGVAGTMQGIQDAIDIVSKVLSTVAQIAATIAAAA